MGSLTIATKSRWPIIAITCLLALQIAVVVHSAAPTDQKHDVVLPAVRQRMFAELRNEASFLDRFFGAVKKVARLTRPTVVHIEAKKPGKRKRMVEEAGSGVLIEYKQRIYILTNRHVIKNAELDKIKVKLWDGRLIYPDRVMDDPATDVAVMLIRSRNLTVAKLGDSRKVEIGDFVLAVGSPFGLSQSVTQGIISAKGRRDLELGDDSVVMQDFLQTDAAINPGNSGGPLVNLRGEVIGINTAIASSSGGSEGIGFTIPIKMAMVVAKQLIENGRVRRAYLGVRMDFRFSTTTAGRLGLARPQGVRVTGITKGSPAERAGIKVDDVLLKIDGVIIDDDDHLANLIGLTNIGKSVTIELWRERRVISLQTEVGERTRFERN